MPVSKPLVSADAAIVPPEVVDTVTAANASFLHNKLVFNGDYFTFMLDIIRAAPCEMCNDPSVKFADVMETTTMQNIVTATEYVVNILSHARDKERTLRPLFEYLQQCYSRYLPACWWLMHTLNGSENIWLHTLLFECTSEPIRKSFSELVCHVLSIVTPYEYPNFLAQETVMVPVPPVNDGEVESTSSTATEGSVSHETSAPTGEPPKMQPISTYVNTVPQFMLRIIVMLDTAPRYWRRFQQFFFVLHQLASSGWEERLFLINHCVIGTMIDMYLGPQSPMAPKDGSPKKGMVVIGDKFSSPDLHHFLGCLSKLVCSCSTDMPHLDRTTKDPTPPTQLQYQMFKQQKMQQGEFTQEEGKPKPLEMYQIQIIAATDRKCLLQKALYNKALASGHNAPAIADILCHWSYGWENYTNSVCEITAEGYERTTADAMAPLELVVTRTFALDDGHTLLRMQKLLDPQSNISILFFAEGQCVKVSL
jgi:hypothetical protein